jgi:hypothetical protein
MLRASRALTVSERPSQKSLCLRSVCQGMVNRQGAGQPPEEACGAMSVYPTRGTFAPFLQPSRTAPENGAMVIEFTWVPVGVVIVVPRSTVTLADVGLTRTRPLVKSRW